MRQSWHRTLVQTKIVQDLFKNNLLFLNNTVKRHPEARLWLRAFHSETHRRVRWKLTLVCDSWFLGCNRGVCLNCTPVAFQHPLMRLRFLWFFVKYLLWFGAFLLGCNEGKVLPSYDIFHTSWVKPSPDAYQPKNTAAKTPLRGILKFRAAADEVENRPQVTSAVLYFVRVRISPYKSP